MLFVAVFDPKTRTKKDFSIIFYNIVSLNRVGYFRLPIKLVLEPNSLKCITII